ncbi:MAG: glycosyltransferase family 4 protein [Elusimicrobiales bacterium]|nr:glycosyltransferase family 4 protein [Elusimicrobiales bacterium]
MALKSNLKILIAAPAIFVYGGAEVLIARLCGWLRARGVEHALLTTAMIPEMREHLGDTRIFVSPNKYGNVPGEILALKRGLDSRAAGFDVVNIHNFPAEIAAFSLKKPSVWLCNEPALHLHLEGSALSLKSRVFFNLLKPLDRFIVRNRVKNVVVSDEFNAARARRLYGVEPEIINYGIDADFFAAGTGGGAAEKYGFAGKFVILQAGMLSPLKNQLASLRALPEVLKTIPDALLVFAGHGEPAYKAALDGYIAARGLGGKVLFTGHVSRDEVRSLMHAAHVLLHPIKSQGGWLSPYEALCAGLPVVASKEMTSSDIMAREEIGVVTDEYAGAVARIHADYAAYKAMAAKGGRYVKASFSWDKFCAAMLACCQKAAERR